jgi:aromatase
LKLSTLHTLNQVEMDALPQVVFRLAGAVEDWPGLLDHYRYVSVLSGPRVAVPECERVVKMGASHLHIPVSWTAKQTLDTKAQEVRYEHIEGVTTGMKVVWRMRAAERGTMVTIDHALSSPRWWLRNPLSSFILGRVFVAAIADKTLRGIKQEAESTSRRKS